MSYCDNCGERKSGGICSNCHEELWIETFQGADYDGPRSSEWLRTVEEQRRAVAEEARTTGLRGNDRRERLAQD